MDLTLDSDSEDSVMPVEPIVKVARSTLRDSDHFLVPIEKGHSVGRQHSICSLGCCQVYGFLDQFFIFILSNSLDFH